MGRDGRGSSTWDGGWSGGIITVSQVFRDNVKLYFGTGKDCWIYSDGTNLYIDTTAGGIYLQDAVYSATHVFLGDNDAIYQGTGSDFIQLFNGTNETITFASLSTAAANGGNFTIACQNAGSTGDRTGGSFNVTAGAKANAGADGGSTYKVGYFDIFPQAGTTNAFIRLDAALTTALTGTIATGSALTAGLELATAAGGIVLDSAAAITLEATTTARVDCTSFSVYPAAGTANQVLTIDVDTTDTLAKIISGSAITTGIELEPVAGAINLDSPGDIILDGGIRVNRDAVTGATASTGRTTAVVGVNRAGVVTITLSTLDCVANRIITIKDEGGNATAYPITVATEGAELIDGAATALIDTAYASVSFYNNGTNWFVM